MSPPNTWTVRQGDTAYSIATAVYDNPEPGWRTLLDANGIVDPRVLPEGLVLLLP